MDTPANDPKRKKAVAETPVDEALKRAAEPVFERHQPVQPTANSGGTQAVGQPVGSAGQALPLDPAAAALARQKVSAALSGILRLIDQAVDRRLHKVATKYSGHEYANKLVAETAMTDDERQSLSDLIAEIAEERGWSVRFLKEGLAISIVCAVGYRKATAVQDLVIIAKEHKAAAAQRAPASN